MSEVDEKITSLLSEDRYFEPPIEGSRHAWINDIAQYQRTYDRSMEDLEGYCEGLASKIAKNSPVAVSHAIKAINAGFRSSASGFQTEIEAFGRCFGSEDFAEGTTAFLEKRPPDFPGR